MARLTKSSQAEDSNAAPLDLHHVRGTNATDGQDMDDTERIASGEYALSLKYPEDMHVLYSHAEDADDERRESAVTTASISSFPDSIIMSDNDLLTPILNLYTPRPPRSSFKWPGSADRGSPSPLGSRSPRRTKLGQRSKPGTPRAILNTDFRGSPRYRRRISEATEAHTEIEEKQYPLVLLHVTLLPLELPWASSVASAVLPADVLENIRQLKAKISETVLNRGILISHPREEYELLEERLLEALELREERVTKCGHFRTRSSISCASDSDSGIGSSVDGSDNELCAICQHHIRPSKAPVGSRDKKWSVKVFAANGLLRPSAWAAAWSDMEAVDVEILPWIDEDLRRRLDETAIEEEVQQDRWRDDGEDRIHQIVEEKVRLILQDRASYESNREAQKTPEQLEVPRQERHDYTTEQMTQPPPGEDVPDIYQPSQIPLSVLLRNYIYLLSQDWRNVAIATLVTIAVFLSFQLLGGGAKTFDLYDNVAYESVLSVPVPSILLSAIPEDTFESRAMETSLPVVDVEQSSPREPLSLETQLLLDNNCTVAAGNPILGVNLDAEVCLVDEIEQ